VRAKVVLGTGVIVCDIVSENEKSIRVMLPNGKVIKRKRDRDIISYLEEDDAGKHEDRRIHEQTDTEHL
jgi:hypothetical protein